MSRPTSSRRWQLRFRNRLLTCENKSLKRRVSNGSRDHCCKVVEPEGCATMPFMNLQAIVNELRDQRDRIQQAIDALERITNSTTSAAKLAGRKPRRHM